MLLPGGSCPALANQQQNRATPMAKKQKITVLTAFLLGRHS
jgi:hypothetical protein